MRKLTCKTGERFGDWVVISPVPIIKNGHTYATVRCECGRIEERALSDLKGSRSSGCKSCVARRRSIPISIGDKYKNWTVIDGPRCTSKSTIQWYVECQCGNYRRWIQGNELVNPNFCFQCRKCSAKDTRKRTTLLNGRVGSLTQTQYTRLKRSAVSRNISWEVSLEDLWVLFEKQHRSCAITGEPLLQIKEASLDRIDSAKGYVLGNVQWTTYQANVSKHTMTMTELYEFCEKVIGHANQHPSQRLKSLEGSETNG